MSLDIKQKSGKVCYLFFAIFGLCVILEKFIPNHLPSYFMWIELGSAFMIIVAMVWEED